MSIISNKDIDDLNLSLSLKSGSELPEGLSFRQQASPHLVIVYRHSSISANPLAHLLSIILLLFLRTNQVDRLSRHFLSESTKKIRHRCLNLKVR